MSERLAGFVDALSGPRRSIVALALGAIAALSMAPLHWSPALIFSFSGFCLLLNFAVSQLRGKQRFWRAAWLGWCFGFGFFVSGLWWIGAAMLVEADQFAWALPLAVAGLPAVLSLLWALASGLAVIFWHNNFQKILALTFFFTVAEYLRGHILTGFPWNVLGYGAMPNVTLMQSAGVIGLWGVTLLTVLVATLPALILLPASGRRPPTVFVLVSMAILLCMHGGYGVWRLANATTEPTSTVLRLVQPNVSQEDKWRQGNEDAVFQSYLDLSSKPGLDQIDAVVWPESAFPFLVLQNPDARARIDDILPADTMLLTGAVRVKAPEATFSATPPKLRFFNSLLVFDAQAQHQMSYDKRHLVPFGEFMPFGDTLERWGITNLVNIPGGFAASDNRNLVQFNSHSQSAPLPPASVLICYEAIFPRSFDLTRALGVESNEPQIRAQWLLNITNDAWFGELAGPYQHFHQARLRAVEEGLPMVRVANTGITAVVDPFGRILDKIGMGETGVIDVALPKPSLRTPYSHFGDLAFAILMALFGATLLFREMRGKAERNFAN